MFIGIWSLHTRSSTITPLKPLNSPVIGVSQTTLPESATTLGDIFASIRSAEKWKIDQKPSSIIK